jgi:hypothetical protein
MAKTPHNDSTELTATILSAAADGLSDKIDLGTARLWAIQMPAAWTGTGLTFLASADGVTFYSVYLSGAEYSLTIAAAEFVVLGSDLIGIQFIQLRSGVAATPVQQASTRTIKLVCLSKL